MYKVRREDMMTFQMRVKRELLAELREIAAELSIDYQQMIRALLAEHCIKARKQRVQASVESVLKSAKSDSEAILDIKKLLKIE
jgi:hypothetical protein